ncbi:MAG: hypothetical protein DSY90_09565 [Deltaproteobacteria bacterium]|nr:MAG: hypothetical protein DSY90_09565 [Deltaproteobacteria bacterium]
MNSNRSKNASLTAIFFLGVLLLTYPLLSLFDQPLLVFGIPLLYLYLFSVWTGLIVLVIFVTQGILRIRQRQPPATKGR